MQEVTRIDDYVYFVRGRTMERYKNGRLQSGTYVIAPDQDHQELVRIAQGIHNKSYYGVLNTPKARAARKSRK